MDWRTQPEQTAIVASARMLSAAAADHRVDQILDLIEAMRVAHRLSSRWVEQARRDLARLESALRALHPKPDSSAQSS